MRTLLKPIVFALSLLILAPAFATNASAHHRSGHHHVRKYKKKRIKRIRRARRIARRFGPPVIYVPRRAPVVVVHRPRPRRIVVHSEPAPPVTVVEVHEDARRGELGIGVRANSIALSGQKIHLSTLENPVMFGPGITFTGRVSEYWDMEIAVDYLQGQESDFSQRSIPITVSGLMLLFPKSRVTPYGVIGGGVNFTQLSYGNGKFIHDITELNGHAGGGLKIRLNKSIAISADVRANLLYKDLGSTTLVADDCIKSGACNGVSTVQADDKIDVGMTFQAGAIFYF